jgi:regulatory protein
MKTIVDITRSAPGRVELKFDDNTTLFIDYGIVNKAGLQVLQKIDDETLDKLINEADGGSSYDAALRYLELRPRSESEMRRHLLSRHVYSTVAIERSIERLKKNKLLDDRSFAEAWINDRITYKPKSRLMIQRELAQKGIDPGEIADVLGDIDDVSSAYQAGIKKAKLLRFAGHLDFSKRLSSYLGRRGYSGEVVRSVVNKLWQEIAEKH